MIGQLCAVLGSSLRSSEGRSFPHIAPDTGLVWKASETNQNLNLNRRVGFGAGSQTTLYTLSYAAYSLESTSYRLCKKV